FAARRRRAARAVGTEFGAATRAREHRSGVAGVIAHACAFRLAAIRAAGAADTLSETITLACCVTLPTMALPPSPTDTFCTVMAGYWTVVQHWARRFSWAWNPSAVHGRTSGAAALPRPRYRFPCS